MSLILYQHPLASFCHKVLMALYENGTPFESRIIDLGDLIRAHALYPILLPLILIGALSKSASLIDGKFVLVKIDVGNFDKNLDIAQSYGNPIKKGIPAAVLLSPDNKILYSTKAGELADARRMGENGIYDFFNKEIVKRQGS